MLTWLISNAASILAALAVLLLVALVIRGMIRDKKAGRSSCGGSCASCGACGGCAGCAVCARPPEKKGNP